MTAHRPALGRNVLHSLVGQVTPGLSAVVAMPFLLHGLGAERLGVLHLTWIIAGYFSILDIGIGRALTHAVAGALARRDGDGGVPAVIGGCMLLGLVGLAGGGLLGAGADWLAGSVFVMSDDLRPEAASAFRWLAVAIPFVTLAAGARGVLEAHQRFDLVNAVRVPTGLLMFAAPVAVLPFADSVVPAVGVTVAVRAVTAGGYLWLGRAQLSGPWPTAVAVRRALRGLVSFGTWIAAANLTGTITQYADRFVVGSWVSLAAVTYYATPLEVVSRLGLIATALMTVMFPAFVTAHEAGDRPGPLYSRTVSYTLLALFPPVLAIVAFAPELLRWWLGAGFAEAGVGTTRLIAAGTLANALAQAPFGLLQATGRARFTAILAALELPGYVLALWVLAKTYGVEGVALAWAGRMTVDALAHFVAAGMDARNVDRSLRAFVGACAVAVALLVLVSMFDGLWPRITVCVAGGLAFAVMTSWLIDVAELAAHVRRVLKG